MAGTRKPLRGGKQRSKWPPEDSTAPDDLEEDIATSQPPVSPWARLSLEMIVMPFVWESLGKRWPELRLGELAQLGEENIKEELSVELVKQLLFLTRAMFGETERQKREIAELQRQQIGKERLGKERLVYGFYGLSGHTGSFCPSKEEKKPPKYINCSRCHQAWAAKCPNRPQPQQQPQLQKQPQPYSQQRSKL
ncbi:hypothetical protein B0T25DRAFT_548161 [Lasiosphaeria hispida]|uniref:Uncharacterized protein n=1 Tax=Lasiosphaeria hispida TaxID=260671 RepID=A0AAJ0HEN8_9PEZI|nr:hypothetical protein B0T25DRAFT_548161 [Lasiosphaeria hispida]